MTQFLYLILCKSETDDGIYKIGIANDVESRLAQLQTGSPYELEIMECYEFENAEIAERAIHQAYSKHRIRGEWFRLGFGAVEKFQTLCELLGGNVFVPNKYELTPDAAEEAESIQETQDILLGSINWRLDRRNGSGYAIFKRGGKKEYLGYVGQQNLKDWEHPTVEEIEAVIEKNSRGRS